MSIDAIITDVRYEDDGTATLVLGPRGPFNEGPGQSSLVVVNPNKYLRGLIGLAIWGGSEHIVHRTKVIADRISYRQIRLRPALSDDSPEHSTDGTDC